jgi:hypothetical protein
MNNNIATYQINLTTSSELNFINLAIVDIFTFQIAEMKSVFFSIKDIVQVSTIKGFGKKDTATLIIVLAN